MHFALVRGIRPFVMGAMVASGACASTPPPPPAPPSAGAGQVGAITGARSADASEAHSLAMRLASCWMGGIWAEGLGEQRDDKAKGGEVRCRDVERRVWPGIDDAVHYEQLRALEANAVAAAESGPIAAVAAGEIDGAATDRSTASQDQ